jgi:uncharacterized membrane protein YkvA (DUF1232 family)
MRRARRRGRTEARSLVARMVPVLPGFLRLLGGLLVDRRVALVDRVLVVGVLAYVLMPLDLIPDFLGILGFADDLFLLALSIRRLIAGAGEEVVRSHWTGSAETLEDVTTGLDELGSLLPGPVKRALAAMVPSRRELGEASGSG